MKRWALGPLTTIRFRLGAAMALALTPVLLLGSAQAVLAFRKDAEVQRQSLVEAAERSAALGRARMEAATALLETLAPEAVGFQCAQRLTQVADQLTGYVNLVRFDALGRVSCAAASVPPDPDRRDRRWFADLRDGATFVLARAPADFSAAPAVLAAAPARTPAGGFDGVLAAVISLDSLRPRIDDASLPSSTEVALADGQGRFLDSRLNASFAPPPPGFAQRVRAQGSILYYGVDSRHRRRVYAAAPLVGDVFVTLSAPAPGLFSWARLNPLSGVLFPLLSFAIALAALWIVAERVVVRWLHYLQRIAAIYARGRFTVRPLQADRAPPEIRDLAHTLEAMADAITDRDRSLRDSLAQKDMLMREIHHRVKNNLQVITSLLSIQQRALDDPAARQAMSDTRQRVNALALIYRALYQRPDLKKVDLRQFLGELIGQLAIERQSSGAGLVRTDLEADELIIDPDKLAPLALFAVEAIANAQKHALALRDGVLHVRFAVRGDEAELSIADEGAGGPEPTLEGEGVGRVLMAAFARQLRGRMELGVNASGGVTAKLIFPNPSLAANEEPLAAGRTKRNRAARRAS